MTLLGSKSIYKDSAVDFQVSVADRETEQHKRMTAILAVNTFCSNFIAHS